MAVWRAADLDEHVTVPGGGRAALRSRADQQITELAVHGWDLAMATGQQAGLDPALADHALSWARQMLRPEHRGPDRAFGPEVPVRPDGRSTSGWQAGPAATRNGHQQAARPITGPEPLLLARRPAL